MCICGTSNGNHHELCGQRHEQCCGRKAQMARRKARLNYLVVLDRDVADIAHLLEPVGTWS